ncbi:MAG TPA: BTAD domain-containing putative transcriptional regulator [Thermoleophilaceae bacterium]|nr:BTAD domain-containing putative transcriptional regulator [Thermoleophilaceae bacterium]
MAHSSFRAQVCGPLVLRVDGERREDALPGRQGRQLTVFLLVNRSRAVTRDQLVEALWWDGPAPDGAQATLSTLLSRLRSVIGADRLRGKGELRLALPADAWIDLEVAEWGVHDAESAVAQGDHARAWAPARAALHASNRGFFPGCEAPWAEERRRHVDNVRLRAHEAIAAAALGLGGPELAAAERSARELIAAAPFRESGYRLLMEYFAARDDVAEALRVYEDLRRLLRDELGVSPSERVSALHGRLLNNQSA